MIKKITFSILACLVYVGFSITNAQAEEISISVTGNGSESQNTVNQSVSQTTTINQSNTADVSNNIDQNLNTGQNSANQNTTEQTSITTGDISSSQTIENNTNSNVADVVDCGCGSSISVANSSNGTGSENTVNTSIVNETQILAGNSANINNNVRVDANSGRNSADSNLGWVQIITGDIDVDGRINNFGNVIVIDVDPANHSNISIFNKFNGSDSINLLNVNIENLINISKYDFSNVSNNVDIDVNTGENSADGNLGNVTIGTGNININFAIDNKQNFDVIRVGLPEEKQPEKALPQPGAPTPGPASVSSPGAAAGQVLAAVALLPTTGPTAFILLVLFWVILTGVGLFLRRVSGLSPPNFAILLK